MRRDPSEQPLITETGLAPGLSEFAYGKLLHLPAAVGALCNVNGKHAGQQLAPRQTMGTRLVGRLGLRFGLIFATRHDLGAVPGAGRQDAVVSYQVKPWRRHEGSQFLE